MTVSPGYIASQNKRWQQANQENDVDLMARLRADSQRAGYKLSPYASAVQEVRNSSSGPTTNPAASSTTPVPAATPQSASPAQSSAFQFKAPDPFTYNKDTDPAYAAAVASAKQNIADEQANTNAYLRSHGQGKSSYSESVANQIGAKEMAKVSTDVLPQLIEAAYSRYADQANRDLQTQQANYGVQQDQFNSAVAEGQLTGTYMPAQGRQYVNAILDLKRQAEAPGVTTEQRSTLSADADRYRAELQAMGVDTSKLGANSNASSASQSAGGLGVQTLAAQQFAYQQARDAISDKQYQQQFDENVRQFGLNLALQQAQLDHQISADNAQLAISRMNAGTSAASAALSRDQFDWSKDPSNPDNVYRDLQIDELRNPQSQAQPQTAEDYYQSIDSSMYLSPETTQDAEGKQVQTGRTIVNNPTGLESYIYSLNLPNAETYKLLQRYGLVKQ